METVSISIDTLKRIISNLESAVSVCYDVDSSEDSGYEKTYPFATGYSRSAMIGAVSDLKRAIGG